MRYSNLATKTRHDAPCDADSINAKLLTQAGFVEKLAAGIYNILPLGHRVFSKILGIIRDEMNAVGGQEILMPALHPIAIWKQTGRDKTMDEILYKTKASGDKDFVFGPSHEETVTPLVGSFITSYKDLPKCVYQIQTKFRDEPRAKSGLLRGREFGMKDMYSFHTTEEDLNEYYDKVMDAYTRVFERCGLKAHIIEASGGAFSDKISHEFSVEAVAGEDKIMICDKCKTAKNSEIIEESALGDCSKCGSPFREMKAIEAGNIFKLGTTYTKAFDIKFTDSDGTAKHPIMGCYGIGTTRLLGTIVEAYHDDKGMIWPVNVAPYHVHLVVLGKEGDESLKKADEIYNSLVSAGVEVFYDDRDESAGKKFADADLMGMPLRLVVSARTLEAGGAEWKLRSSEDGENVSFDELETKVKDFVTKG